MVRPKRFAPPVITERMCFLQGSALTEVLSCFPFPSDWRNTSSRCCTVDWSMVPSECYRWMYGWKARRLCHIELLRLAVWSKKIMSLICIVCASGMGNMLLHISESTSRYKKQCPIFPLQSSLKIQRNCIHWRIIETHLTHLLSARPWQAVINGWDGRPDRVIRILHQNWLVSGKFTRKDFYF